MSLKISEKNKPRLTLIVILLVFVSITAYSLSAESKTEITVDEGYDEFSIKYLNYSYSNKTQGIFFYNSTTDTSTKNATALTHINGNNSSLQFTVLGIHITYTGSEQYMSLKLQVKGYFEEEYDPKKLLFKMRELDGKNVYKNNHDFLRAGVRTSNLNLWPGSDCEPGTRGNRIAYIGFDIEDNYFSVSKNLEVVWNIPRPNWNNSYTLRLKTVVKGMSKVVTTTVDVNVHKDVIK